MPELPEVETTRRGIEPHVVGETVAKVIVRQRALRWPIPVRLQQELRGQIIEAVDRRSKYLLLRTRPGTVILHLGMSGSLCLINSTQPAEKHDHVDFVLENGTALRLTDPRRFGSIHWTRQEPDRHWLLKKLGPEPLTDAFSGEHLYAHSRNRRVAVKQFIMNSQTVAGVGNIYASESLFLAGIHPLRAAGRISLARYDLLAAAIKNVLEDSIAQGGTTLRDFVNSDGKPGYFQQYLRVYGRDGQPCINCKQPLRLLQQGQRSSFYCPRCQR